GEDAEFFAGILRDLQAGKKLGPNGVEHDPYTSTQVEGEVLALIVNGEAVDSASLDDPVEVILPKTGFYIEAGGQVSDTGFIRGKDWQIEVTDMRRASAGMIVHIGEVISGHPKVGDKATVEVDMTRRHDIMRNHTATHLLHKALHEVLGEHARQAGSLVAPDRLRFDFTHPEAIVNHAIAADMAVEPVLRPRDQAIAEGAMALFGEKYGETVRTLTIGDAEEKYSYELCGGTHLERTSDAGAFLILSEGSAAAGIRRFEAVTGRGAYDLIAQRFKTLKSAAVLLKSSVEEVPGRVEALQEEVSNLKKELADIKGRSALAAFNDQLADVHVVKGVKVLAVNVPGADVDTLRSLADVFREKYPKSGAAVLASGSLMISVVTEDLVKRGLKASDLIAGIGGKGGGRPNLAQGSLPDGVDFKNDVGKIDKVIEAKLK
ncbi:MAG: alanine--tRNA ligase, partial [Anaerolineaceae bacterium]|nr:alanine--tRNA ligase [Anaerolineaceae bacterium]